MKSFIISVCMLAILSLIALYQLQSVLKHGREKVAFETLREIHNAETKYRSTHGKFGSLAELAEAGLISSSFAFENQLTSTYQYRLENSVDTYCGHATRESVGKGFRDFNIDQTGTVRYVKSKTVAVVPWGTGTSYEP